MSRQIVGSLRCHDSDGSENVTCKLKWRERAELLFCSITPKAFLTFSRCRCRRRRDILNSLVLVSLCTDHVAGPGYDKKEHKSIKDQLALSLQRVPSCVRSRDLFPQRNPETDPWNQFSSVNTTRDLLLGWDDLSLCICRP